MIRVVRLGADHFASLAVAVVFRGRSRPGLGVLARLRDPDRVAASRSRITRVGAGHHRLAALQARSSPRSSARPAIPTLHGTKVGLAVGHHEDALDLAFWSRAVFAAGALEPGVLARPGTSCPSGSRTVTAMIGTESAFAARGGDDLGGGREVGPQLRRRVVEGDDHLEVHRLLRLRAGAAARPRSWMALFADARHPPGEGLVGEGVDPHHRAVAVRRCAARRSRPPSRSPPSRSGRRW